jgi:hypothetical protein
MSRASSSLASVLLLGLGSCSAPFHSQPASALETARAFYSSYVKIQGSPSDYILAKRSELITEQLAAALHEDRAAAAANADEIVGFDADPFLDTQDPCERYEPAAGQGDGKRAVLPVFGTCAGKRDDKPAFRVELVQKQDRWRISNIYFERGSDLLSELRQLKKDRETPSP